MRSLTFFSFLLLITTSSGRFIRYSLPESSITYFICELEAPPGQKFASTVPRLSINGGDNYTYFDSVGDYLDPSRYHGNHIPDFSLELLSGSIRVLNFKEGDFESISCLQYLNNDTLMQHQLMINDVLQPDELSPTTPVIPSEIPLSPQLPTSSIQPNFVIDSTPQSPIWKPVAITLAVILILVLCCCMFLCCKGLPIFLFLIYRWVKNSCSYDTCSDSNIAPSLSNNKGKTLLRDTTEHVELGAVNPSPNSPDSENEIYSDDGQEENSDQPLDTNKTSIV